MQRPRTRVDFRYPEYAAGAPCSIFMTDPYRDANLVCPACDRTLREFRGRLVCDTCDGIMLTVDDLVAGIHDMTSVVATFEWTHEKPGTAAKR